MTTPKRHHYVPQMILNGFADEQGWLHWRRFDEIGSTIRRARPRELFVQNHLYSTVSGAGTKDPAMERALANLETQVTPLVTSILASARNRECPMLSEEQRRIWYWFFLTQWRRTPETQQTIINDNDAAGMLDDILAELRLKYPSRVNEIDALSTPEEKARTVRNTRIDLLGRINSNVLQVLERRGISVIKITRRNKSFIIGSRPVAKLTPSGTSDLNDLDVEMWFPIASDVAVGVGRGDGRVSLHFISDDRPIRRLNVAIAAQSSIIAAASPELVQAISNRR